MTVVMEVIYDAKQLDIRTASHFKPTLKCCKLSISKPKMETLKTQIANIGKLIFFAYYSFNKS